MAYLLVAPNTCSYSSRIAHGLAGQDAATIGPLTKTFILMILTQFNVIIKCWRTDGGSGEFLNGLIDSIYKDHGMIHQPSTPYVKQQNGVVERRIQTLK